MFSHAECHPRGQAYDERGSDEKEQQLSASPLEIRRGARAGAR
jgi:hypothetical protein